MSMCSTTQHSSINGLSLAFVDTSHEATFCRQTSMLRGVDAYAIAFHGITAIAAVLKDLWMLLADSSGERTRMMGSGLNHAVGTSFIFFTLLFVCNPWLRSTPRRNTYLTAIRLVTPLFHLVLCLAFRAVPEPLYRCDDCMLA